ncbi:MAG: DUF47 family protein [Candidatus Gastranaerophilales bacterium]|nr:DUF47 family protein [Candidatus Gastranaerophilales bacterium]
MLAGLIKRILPPQEEYFYKSFESTTIICKNSCNNLLDVLTNGYSDDKVQKAKEYKRASARISEETLERLNQSFVTPIDREDIQHITSSLHKINRRICRACVNIKLFQIEEFDERIINQAKTLETALNELFYMVELLKNHKEVKSFVESYEKINEIETQGDEIFSNVIEDLFSGRYEAIDVIKLRDIHNNIETALNTSVIVADDITQIALKHG